MNRALTVIAIAIVLGIGVYLINQTRNDSTTGVDSMPTVTLSAAQDSAEAATAVQSFYDWYNTCSRSGEECDFSTQTTVDAPKLTSLVASTQTFNPITCSQDVPESFRADRATINSNGTATVSAIETFSANSQKTVYADVEQQNGSWKIVDITCPES